MRSWKSVATVAVLTATVLFFLGCEDLPLFPGSPFGDNTTRANAFEIELGTEYGARIRENDSVQWFKFTTAHSEQTWDEVLVEITIPDDDLRTRLELYDANGEYLERWTQTTAGADLNATIRRRGGTFYLRFSGNSAYSTIDHGSSGRYNFTVANQNANDDYGPNHSIDDAYTIEANVTYHGVIVHSDEADYFHFEPTGTPSDDYVMTITDVSNDPRLRMRRTFYFQNMEYNTHFVQQDGGIPPAVTINNAGNGFYVRISGNSQYSTIDHGSRGTYSFRIEPVD